MVKHCKLFVSKYIPLGHEHILFIQSKPIELLQSVLFLQFQSKLPQNFIFEFVGKLVE
jgi:hypothetical protein